MKKKIVICGHYSYENDNKGVKFNIPSPTTGDLSHSIKDLLNTLSIDQLPSVASLQQYFDDMDDVDMDASSDVRVSDKVEALQRFLDANNMRRSVFDRLKQLHDFRKNEWRNDLERYRRAYGDLPPDEKHE